jgi:hypothetical protein
LASRTSKVSVKLGDGRGVDGGPGGDVVLVGGGEVGGGGVLVDGGEEGWGGSPVGPGVAVSTARAEGVTVCPVVGAALGAMVGFPGSSGRSGCRTVGTQVGVADGVVVEGVVGPGGNGR